MKKSFNIFLRDCRRIKQSPVAILVLIGVVILPCLYAWVNIAAYEDPYGYTSGLKVAVANNDSGYFNEIAGELNAGEKVVTALKDNQSLGWVFTSKKEAIHGVRSGKYYAAIVIPDSFSEDLLSITNGKLQQPILEYYVNEKKNAMAPLIMNVGANTLKNQVNKQFIDSAVEAVSDTAQSIMDDLGLRLESVHQSVSNDLKSVSENLTQYEEMVGELNEQMQDRQKTDQDVRSTLAGISQAADSGRNTLTQADQTLNTGRDALLDFSNNLNRNLTDGNTLLSEIRRKSDLDFYDLNAKTQAVNWKIASAVDLLQEINEWDGSMIRKMEDLNANLSLQATEDLLHQLYQENQSHAELLQALQSGNQAVGDAASKTLNNAALIQSGIDEGQNALVNVQNSWSREMLEPMIEKLDSLSWFLGRSAGILEPVDSQITQMNAILDGLNQAMDQISSSLEETRSEITNIREQVDNTLTELNLLAGSEEYQKILSTNIDGQKLSGYISSPVSLKTESFFKVRNYGTAMSPFFTNLAIWVGGIVLLSLFKLEVDLDEEIKEYRPYQGYLGRLLIFMFTGLCQALTVCLGDLLMLKVQCEHPFLFIIAGMVASLVYVNLIYALGTTLKHVGKALCVVILIFQIPSSSGTYPVEMTSQFFRVLNPVLPFTYGVDAMREAEIGIYGYHYVLDLLRLSIFIGIALILGVTLRFAFINLNILFDKKLAETDLMICEEEAAPEQERFRMVAAIRLLTGRERFHKTTEDRIQKFETQYQQRIRTSFRIVLVFLPLLFMTLMFAFGGSRIIFLILWIVSLIALMVYQILVEYFREHLDRLQRMADMSDEELLQLLHRQKETGKGDPSRE